MYTKLRRRGRGGFAVVYEVADSDGKICALKEFAPGPHLIEAAGEDHLKKRFSREVRHQQLLDHPHIVPIYAACPDASPPFFTMELAQGSLKDDIEGQVLDSSNLPAVLFNILAGLEAIHKAGYVHRDLKPANVLRFETAEGRCYKISDFGLISHGHGDSSTLTNSGQAGGTEMYAAPELMSDFKRATPASDIYSFGAILHDIFMPGTRRIPYTELAAEGPIGPVISKCTRRQPRRRYQSVAEVREDLIKVIDTVKPVAQTAREAEFIALLNAKIELDEKEWDDLFDYVDEAISRQGFPSALFAAIKLDHIETLAVHSPELFASLGRDFSDYVKRTAFSFEFCDVLGDKLNAFYAKGGIELQAHAATAMLVLGVDHNRWYVEHLFTRMAGKEVSDTLARRIRVMLDDEESNVSRLLSHLSKSINFDLSGLHPFLTQP